jgi:hypothetical protein
VENSIRYVSKLPKCIMHFGLVIFHVIILYKNGGIHAGLIMKVQCASRRFLISVEESLSTHKKVTRQSDKFRDNSYNSLWKHGLSVYDEISHKMQSYWETEISLRISWNNPLSQIIPPASYAHFYESKIILEFREAYMHECEFIWTLSMLFVLALSPLNQSYLHNISEEDKNNGIKITLLVYVLFCTLRGPRRSVDGLSCCRYANQF